MTDATKWCSYCEKDKPQTEFLRIKQRGWRVTYCNECVNSNMARYAASMSTVRDVGKMARDAKE